MARGESQDRPDLTMMYAIHAALRRDLARLQEVPDRDRSDVAVRRAVDDGWGLFRSQLHVHHQAEDTSLWPRLRERVGDQPEALAVLDEMVEEHGRIDPALDAVDQAFACRGNLADAIGTLATLTEEHLVHEERAALPLIERHLSAAEWEAFLHEQRRLAGVRGRPAWLAWLLDDADPELAGAVLASMPRPAGVVYRVVLRRLHARRRRWA
jgi:hemerythrin-like domain-containing protein